MTSLDSFRAALCDAGLDYAGPLVADGKIHRFKAAGDKARNSWFILFPGTPTAGAFGCWKRGITEKWCERTERSLSDSERHRLREQWQRAEVERVRDEGERRAEARQEATRILNDASATGVHSYLQHKGVKSFGDLRDRQGKLVLPLRDATGELHSLQFIYADGEKRFLTGGRVAGCFFTISAREDGPLVICEGYATGASIHEATGHAVVCAMDCGNLKAVTESLRALWPDRDIIIAADNDAFTKDKAGRPFNPGVEAATAAAQAIRARLAIPQFADVKAKPTDFNDLHQLEGINTVKEQNTNATTPAETDDQALARLASLAPLEYERAREAEAKRMNFRVTVLDAEVEKLRPKREQASNAMEPWAETVNGADLLDSIAAEFRKFLVLPPHADTILALWTLHSYSWEQCEYSPIVAITSPVRSCGKSRVLDVLEKVVCNPFRTGNMSEPVLFRVLDARKPSVLIDEFDTIPEDRRDALANILKHGFHRAGRVHRVEGDSEKKVVEFLVFGPKALACIKLSTLDAPTVSRCINIRMQRKKSAQKVARLRRYSGTEWQQKCLRWANDHREQIEAATAAMPDALGDREQDIYEPLFVLANLAGGDWSDKITRAALALCGEPADAPTDSAVLLLSWIQTHFAESATDKVSSAELVQWLNKRADAPFSAWNNGKGIGQNEVRRLLAGFDVQPNTVRLGEKTAKGFKREWFQDAFDSYLPGSGNTVTTPENTGDHSSLSSVTSDGCYEPEKCYPTNEHGHCYPVTTATPDLAKEGELIEADLL